MIQNKKTENVKLIAYFLFAIVLIWSVFGCGSRRVDKSKTEIKETTKTESVKVDSSTTTIIANRNIKFTDNSQVDELSITPIDERKEMVVGGKSFFNAKLSTKKVRNNKTVTETIKASKIEQKAVKTIDKSQSSKSAIIEMKKTDKKQFNFLSLWWLLLIIPIYFLWKKYRGLMPF